MKKIKSIGLLSGGLDSCLAIKLVASLDIEVLGLSFITPFFSADKSISAADFLNIPIKIIDFTEEHFEMLKNPRYGYGKNMNPCIDCHALMFKKAGDLMKQLDYDFIFSGEVLNERPMSQNKISLKKVEKLSGYEGYILRPLSAKLLDPSIPEKEGKIDRTKLLDINGRSRKKQFELAEKFNIKSYPTPAGGCLLTDKNFSLRLKDLISINSKPRREELELLKFGRIFKLNDNCRFIIGRNEKENNEIEKLKFNDYIIDTPDVAGPIGVLLHNFSEANLMLAANILVSYSDAEINSETKVVCGNKSFYIKKTDKSNFINLMI
ncbi:tRNA 4-thiouridine(8) synthase ThiI [Candidatus Dependentiae bacterium]|nr:tRNA 4-thiouridine(8) synthase ThiI [Candidatus Dependentiae bacterium]